MQRRDRFWRYWLIVAALGVAAFGAVLVVAPALGRRIFGLLLFSSPSGIERWAPRPCRTSRSSTEYSAP